MTVIHSALWTALTCINNGLTHLALHPHWNDQTLRGCLLCQMRGYSKTQIISHQRGLPTSHQASLIDKRVFGAHSAKALLLRLLFGAVVGKNSVVGSRPELGGDSGWLSENLSGRWWVICWDCALVGSVENESTRLPNRPWVRWKCRHICRHVYENIAFCLVCAQAACVLTW